MKKAVVCALAMVMALALCACGNSGSGAGSSGSPESSGSSGNQGSASSAGQKADYTFGTESVRVWENSGNTLIEIQVPITNNTNDLLYCRTVDFRLVNAKGEAVFSATCSDMAPTYLEPGDTGIIYHMQKYLSDEPYSDDLKLEYEATIEVPSWTVQTFEVSDLTFDQPTSISCVIRGTIINGSDKDLEQAMVSIRLYDAQNNIIGAAFGYADGTIGAGETGTFMAQRYDVEGGLGNIASYKAIAYVAE